VTVGVNTTLLAILTIWVVSALVLDPLVRRHMDQTEYPEVRVLAALTAPVILLATGLLLTFDWLHTQLNTFTERIPGARLPSPRALLFALVTISVTYLLLGL